MPQKSFTRSLLVLAAMVLLTATAFARVPSSQHVILIIDENSSFPEAMANMPWLVSQGVANGFAANYKSDNGGSLLDYLWMASGSCQSAANCALPPGSHDFNCNGNDCYYPGTQSTDPITDNNIFRQMNEAGISWKVYAQSYAAAGGTPTSPDNNNGTSYYRRHNGATWYSDILSNTDGSANNIVDLSQLAIDLASGNLPRFMIIVPDGNHDAHDCPVGMKTCTEEQKLSAADSFLSTTLTPILATANFQKGGDGLIFVTFDECGGGTDQGCGAAVYTTVIGPKVTPHIVSTTSYKHENTLRTIFDALRLTNYPGVAATASDMSDFFGPRTKVPVVVIESPYDSAAVSSPVSLLAAAYPSKKHSISSWSVFVDGTSVYTAGAVSTINPSLPMSSGVHTVSVRSSDTSGASGDTTISITVGPKPMVQVATPADDANVGSPVNIVAAASPSPGATITGWRVYVDSSGVYQAGPVNQINANVPMSAGSHDVVVRAWDTSGAFGDQTLDLTVSNKPAVAVAAPVTGANVVSPFALTASASPSSGHSITGWKIYVDGVSAYSAGAVTSIETSLQVASGIHTVIARAWDSSRAYGDQTLSLNICTVAVNINAPMNGASVNSPVPIQAAAASGASITGWHIYIDGVDSFSQKDGNSLSTSLAMNSGTHAVLVRAWDRTGAFGDQTIQISVP